MTEPLQILVNAGGAVAVAGAALYYIDRMSQRFTRTVDSYMTDKLKVDSELARQLQKLSDTNVELKKEVAEARQINEKVYIQLALRAGIKLKGVNK